MATKKEPPRCAVLGCVVRPKGAESACAAHRATYTLQQEIMRRQQLEQEVEQLVDLILNFAKEEQMDLLKTGFPDHYEAWEGENAKQETLPSEGEPPCCSAICLESQTNSPPGWSSGSPSDSQPTPAHLAPERGDLAPRAAPAKNRVPPRALREKRRLPAPPPKTKPKELVFGAR